MGFQLWSELLATVVHEQVRWKCVPDDRSRDGETSLADGRVCPWNEQVAAASRMEWPTWQVWDWADDLLEADRTSTSDTVEDQSRNRTYWSNIVHYTGLPESNDNDTVIKTPCLLLLLSWRAHQALPIWGDKDVQKRWGIPWDSGSGGIHLSLVIVVSYFIDWGHHLRVDVVAHVTNRTNPCSVGRGDQFISWANTSSEVSPSRLLSFGTHFHSTSIHCTTVSMDSMSE